MKKLTWAILAAAVILAGLSAVHAGDDGKAVRIYMPATVRVSGNTLELGSLVIARCDSDELTARVGAVAMGRAPWSREQITIDRATILSRLASSGIDQSQVQISGAEKIIVERDEKIISAQQLVATAQDYLQQERPGPAGCLWKLSRTIGDLAVPMVKDYKLQVKPIADAPADQIKLLVSVISGNTVLGSSELAFKVLYASQQAVTTKDMPAGAVISKDNVCIQDTAVEVKPATPFMPPYGMIAISHLPKGTVLRDALVSAPKPQLLVKRNQEVTMRVHGNGFVVTAVGESLEDGRGGNLIKVRNTYTKRVVTAKIGFDGTVEPIAGDNVK